MDCFSCRVEGAEVVYLSELTVAGIVWGADACTLLLMALTLL